ncbi:MAG: DUF3800 domain-containing protein [Deltaproteobacteria bacterium]|nr:DUF3800 domain-containing protein [Deltaproteobacteria bacterium]
MYISYYDEAGDDGFPGSSEMFVITALYLHFSDWQKIFDQILDLRREFKSAYALPVKLEFHTRHFLASKHPFFDLSMTDDIKTRIMDDFCDFIASQPLKLINVVIDKRKITNPPYPILDNAFKYSIQRIENDLNKTDANKRFIIITDPGREKKMQRISRRIQRINFIPSKIEDKPYRSEIKKLIEDPLPKPSNESYFIQLADIVVTIVYLFCIIDLKIGRLPKRLPNGVNQTKIYNWLDRLKPSLNLAASGNHPYGLVIYPK